MMDTETEISRPADVPPAASGYVASRLNALRHGVLSRYAVLPWEDPADYQALLEALVTEHLPMGPTEEHLVEELAGVMWRKRRLRLAEAATYQRGLYATTESHRRTAEAALVLTEAEGTKVEVRSSLRSTPAATKREIADLEADCKMTAEALAILTAGRKAAYKVAQAVLHESTREAWENQLTWEPGDYTDGATPYKPDSASLQRYLESEIAPWYDEQREALAARPIVRAQALGEALDPDKLERLGRYEVHLDRKLERTLSTLIRLQQLRHSRATPAGG